MRLLAEGIDTDGAPRVIDRSLELTLALKVADEPGESLDQALLQSLLFGENPFFEVARQESPAVQLHRSGQELGPVGRAGRLRAGLERALPFLHVRRHQSGIQLYREPIGSTPDPSGGAAPRDSPAG